MENSSTSASSPSSPHASDRAFGLLPTLGVCLGLVLVVVGVLAAGLALAFASHPGTFDPRHLGIGLVLRVQIAAEAAAIAYMFAVLPWVGKRSLREFGFRVPAASQVGWALLGGLIMLFVVQGLATILVLVFHLKYEQLPVQLLHAIRDSATLWWFLVLVAGIAPVAEELIFRVFFFNVARRYTFVWLAALFSGVLFATAHADAVAFIPLALGGMVLCGVYYRTQNAWMSMISHAIFNAATAAALLLARHAVH
ncbi:MAG: hypothetical protein NVS1B14_06590 [Vulcanimicrobiaceae bacterium]